MYQVIFDLGTNLPYDVWNEYRRGFQGSNIKALLSEARKVCRKYKVTAELRNEFGLFLEKV